MHIGASKLAIEFDVEYGHIKPADPDINKSIYYTLAKEHGLLKEKYRLLEEKYIKSMKCLFHLYYAKPFES